MWNTEELVSALTRLMGFKFKSPRMKHAVRQVMHRYLNRQPRFAENAVSPKPLEPWPVVSEPKTLPTGSVVQAFSVCHEGSYAVVDTGCQRSAVGINTLKVKRIMDKLPLQVKFAPQQYRFSGTGGDTITKQVALIPVCFGKTPGMIRAAVLEDTAGAPLLLSLPILQALGTSINLGSQSMDFQAIQEVGKCFSMQEVSCVFVFLTLKISNRLAMSRWTNGVPRKSLGMSVKFSCCNNPSRRMQSLLQIIL